ncbi:MAG TPA: hypothetical protein VF385_01530, partial [Patescibacteria group bacterium]
MKFNKIIIGLGLCALILSILPFAVNIFMPVTPGRVNPHWNNWPYDFNYYRSVITQGKNGRITTVDKYTSENQSGKFLRISYIVLGHFSKVFNLDETVAYHIARIFLGVIFIFFIYLLIKISLKERKSIIPLVFLLCLFSAGYPDIICQPVCHLVPRLWSMTQLDPIRRITFIPHFLYGQIAFIFVLYILLNSNKSLKWLITAGLFLGIAGLDHPPSLMLIFPVLGLTIFSLAWKKALTKNLLIKFSLIILTVIPFSIYLFIATNSFPWILSRQAEFSLGVNFIDFSLALGPTFIIGMIGAIIIFFSKKDEPIALIISASWLIAVIILTFITNNFFNYSQTRFLQVAPHVPSSILTGYVIWGFYKKLISYFPNKKKAMIIYTIVLLLTFLPTLSTLYLLYYDQFDYEIYFAKNSLPNIPYPPYIDYPPVNWMEGFTWLKNNSKPNEIVLSDFTAGNFIPTYGGNTVFYGHGTETFDAIKKNEAIVNFFKSENANEQKLFLIKNRINYI